MIEFIATDVKFLGKTLLECTFQDGKIYQYDVSKLFSSYPPLKELKTNHDLFKSGKLDFGGTAIIWNDLLDISTFDVHEDGVLVGEIETTINNKIGILLVKTMDELGVNQTKLSELSGINQGDISRIIYGKGNPTLKKIEKLFNALGKQLEISVK